MYACMLWLLLGGSQKTLVYSCVSINTAWEQNRSEPNQGETVHQIPPDTVMSNEFTCHKEYHTPYIISILQFIMFSRFCCLDNAESFNLMPQEFNLNTHYT